MPTHNLKILVHAFQLNDPNRSTPMLRIGLANWSSSSRRATAFCQDVLAWDVLRHLHRPWPTVDHGRGVSSLMSNPLYIYIYIENLHVLRPAALLQFQKPPPKGLFSRLREPPPLQLR